MRIDQLHLQNFKGFADRKFSFHPQFNLIIGDNASGKTTILDALAVAMGTWFLGMPGLDARNIRAEDVRTVTITESRRYELLDQYPVEVKARGVVNDTPVAWTRTLKGPENRTTRSGATGLTRLAEAQADLIRAGEPATLPVLSYYGAGRLWLEPRDRSRPETDHAYGISPEAAEAAGDHDAAYFARRMVGYRYSVDDRCSARDLLRWLRYQRRVEVDEETESVPYRVVIAALKHVLNATSVAISLRYGTLIADIPGSGRIPFEKMSDGYRNVAALVGDLAYKCAVLNPHLEKDALRETPGVVLIDELDLYLHPIWQRRIIEDLRTIFPRIQFFCTTHSPFLIQSLRSGEELLMLQGQPLAVTNNLSLEDIAAALMGVDTPAQGARYSAMKEAAAEYLAMLNDAASTPEDRRDVVLDRMSRSIAPFADNPAFQAFLEMKRVARLGG
jgi:predicted ATP-binding protein involved in virulence